MGGGLFPSNIKDVTPYLEELGAQLESIKSTLSQEDKSLEIVDLSTKLSTLQRKIHRLGFTDEAYKIREWILEKLV